jgi:NurA-like 5'-3' nuclease
MEAAFGNDDLKALLVRFIESSDMHRGEIIDAMKKTIIGGKSVYSCCFQRLKAWDRRGSVPGRRCRSSTPGASSGG